MQGLESYHAHRAKLSQLGEGWHKKIHYGNGPWDGDRFVFLYHHVLTDDIEVRYELPNARSELIAKIPFADFDVDKLCYTLAAADNRKKSVQTKVDESDAHNDKLEKAVADAKAEDLEELTEKMRWAMRKDTGHHVAPMTVNKRGKL